MPGRPMRGPLGLLTERGLGLLVGAVALWAAARSLGVPELQMAAVALLVLLALAVVFVVASSLRLDVDRLVRPGRLFHDQTAEVELTLRNHSRLPTSVLEVRDTVPGALTSRAATVLPPLRGGQRTTVRYPVHGVQRGRFELGPVTVALRDPFGLVSRRRTLPGAIPLTVYPPLWRLANGVSLGGSASSGGEGRPRPIPSGEDLANVREYVRGDDLRSVHWPTTAHRGKLMVRQSESPQDPRVVLVLDAREKRHRGHGPTASFETAVSLAASITYHVATRGRQVVLLDRPLLAPPRALAWEEWLERLAEATPSSVDLNGLLADLGRGGAGAGTLIAVLTVPEPGELRTLVRAGRAFTTRLAMLVDADSHERQGPSGVAEVQKTAAALASAGWRVAVVAAGDRLDERWQDLLRQRRVPTGAHT